MRRARSWTIAALVATGCIDAPEGARTDAGSPGSPDASGDQLLANPGFEEGVADWVYQPGGSPRIATYDMLAVPSQEGEYAAEVGGTPDQTDIISQEVMVPEDATGLTLGFYRCVLSAEPPGAPVYDQCDVRALIDGGDVTLYDGGNQDSTASCEWVFASVVVSPLVPGEPIEIRLFGSNDTNAPTRCLYDSFELRASYD